VCLRIAEIGEYAVAHISHDEPPDFAMTSAQRC
jgi:hypothetical protein